LLTGSFLALFKPAAAYTYQQCPATVRTGPASGKPQLARLAAVQHHCQGNHHFCKAALDNRTTLYVWRSCTHRMQNWWRISTGTQRS